MSVGTGGRKVIRLQARDVADIVARCLLPCHATDSAIQLLLSNLNEPCNNIVRGISPLRAPASFRYFNVLSVGPREIYVYVFYVLRVLDPDSWMSNKWRVCRKLVL